MYIHQIYTPRINFGYKHRLKTEWLKGNIPELIHDFYDGSKLDPKTVTLEHLLPHSKGGKTTLSNLVLTSYSNNIKRSNKDIAKYINIEAAKQYLKEAENINIKGIHGKNYCKAIINRLKSLGIDLTK